jgi:hypothetical protein
MPDHDPDQRPTFQLVLQPSNLPQSFDLVAFSVFKREKRESTVKLSEGSQVSQITKLMKVLESAADSSNNRSAFKRAG